MLNWPWLWRNFKIFEDDIFVFRFRCNLKCIDFIRASFYGVDHLEVFLLKIHFLKLLSIKRLWSFQYQLSFWKVLHLFLQLNQVFSELPSSWSLFIVKQEHRSQNFSELWEIRVNHLEHTWRHSFFDEIGDIHFFHEFVLIWCPSCHHEATNPSDRSYVAALPMLQLLLFRSRVC